MLLVSTDKKLFLNLNLRDWKLVSLYLGAVLLRNAVKKSIIESKAK
jgi:hypothetical protein